MPRKAQDKYKKLKSSIVRDMKRRNAYSAVDDHLIDNYVSLCKTLDALLDSVNAGEVVTEGARSGEDVANPALVRLPSVTSSVLAMAKTLGIGPYSRKLITGQQDTKKKEITKASVLRPFNHKKAN